MPKKPLLLSSAKSGILLGAPVASALPSAAAQREYAGGLLRYAAFAAGVGVVLLGTFDLASRVGPLLPRDAGVSAFAPAIVALDPVAREAVAAPARQTPFVPTHLVFPALGIDTQIEHVGVKADGAMATPSSFRTVGWYEYGAKPLEAGNAILAGHVNNGLGLSGVFTRLGEVPLGAEVLVQGEDGIEQRYVVKEKKQYDANDAPLADIFSTTGPSRLVLITCEGDWDAGSRSYDKRLVVIAEPAP